MPRYLAFPTFRSLFVMLIIAAIAMPVGSHFASSTAWADDPAPASTPTAVSNSNDPPAGFVEITPDARTAIEKGLAYLSSVQNEDGSYQAQGLGKNVAITGLAALAFMADGNLPDRGRYGSHVQRGLEYILNHTQENGLIASNTSHGPMYGHGFATLFLGEVYGMTDDPRVREVLIKAIRLIIASQNPQGGWRYQPIPVDADISVTICQIMALRSAKDAGLAVPKSTIDRAIDYVRQCQNPNDGGFRYMLNSGGSAFPRSAAGVASLYYAGIYQDNALTRGLDYLVRSGLPGMGAPQGGYFFYGQYYAVQAMFLAGGKDWEKWFPAIRQDLLRRQKPDGSWDSSYGPQYGSAMALLILQVPNRFLPIFQR